MTYKFSTRLAKALEERNLKPVDLSNGTGLSQALISQYLNDKTAAKNDRITIIAKFLDVSESWLAGFTDEMGYFNIEKNRANNLYGDHSKNLVYLADKPELLDLYMKIHDSETLQLLFDSSQDLSAEDLETVLIHIKGIKKARGLDWVMGIGEQFEEFCYINNILINFVNDLNTSIRGFCYYDGEYFNIVLNANLCGYQLKKTTIHEIIHIMENHFEKKCEYMTKCEKEVEIKMKEYNFSYGI